MLGRFLFLGAAGCFFFIGAIGVIIPGLPTTPFLLLTSYCLVRSSPRLNALLLRSRFFGPLLADWRTHRGVRKRVKIVSILLVSVAVTCSVLFVIDSLWIDAFVILAAVLGVFVIASLPVIRESSPKETSSFPLVESNPPRTHHAQRSAPSDDAEPISPGGQN